MAKLHLPRLYVMPEYEVEDEEEEAGDLIHTDAHPFCDDLDCDCHNQGAYEEYLEPGLNDGTMTGAEALRKYFGK